MKARSFCACGASSRGVRRVELAAAGCARAWPASSRAFGSVRLPFTRTSPLRMMRWMWLNDRPGKRASKKRSTRMPSSSGVTVTVCTLVASSEAISPSPHELLRVVGMVGVADAGVAGECRCETQSAPQPLPAAPLRCAWGGVMRAPRLCRSLCLCQIAPRARHAPDAGRQMDASAHPVRTVHPRPAGSGSPAPRGPG